MDRLDISLIRKKRAKTKKKMQLMSSVQEEAAKKLLKVTCFNRKGTAVDIRLLTACVTVLQSAKMIM
jgi:hypothetical protein